jgi:hypothetical protein
MFESSRLPSKGGKDAAMNMRMAIGAAVPYAAVLAGLWWLRSAWVSILLYHAGILLLMAARRRWAAWRSLLRGVNGPALGAGVIVCALAGPAVCLLWPWLHLPDVALREWLPRYGLGGWSWIGFVIYFSILHPVLEEAHWRSLSPSGLAFSWLDLAFAGYHVLVLALLLKGPWLFLAFAVLAGASWAWRAAAARFGGWAVPLWTHATADASVILAAWQLGNPEG